MMNRYDYLFLRREYPLEGGYRMEPKPLPPWIYITITENKGTKYVDVHSRLHVNTCVRLATSFSMDFSDRKILIDISGEVTRRFL